MALTRITKGVIKPNENYDTHNIVSTGIVTSIGLDVNGNADISGSLSVGGVLSSGKSLIPVRLISSVRGIGVAVRVRTSTLLLNDLIFSLCVTPNRCSSSITSKPRSLNLISSDSRRCVPMMRSISPSLNLEITCLASLLEFFLIL